MSFIVFTVAKNKKHDASTYRAIAREGKVSGTKQLEALLAEARQLDDPYYRALALFSLSSNPKLAFQKAVNVAEDALGMADEVEQLWRRAELLGALVNKANTWGDNSAGSEREMFKSTILDAILTMPNGKGLSDAIVQCTPKLGTTHLLPLLNKAVLNRGFETHDAKVVIRQWIKLSESNGPIINDIQDTIFKVKDPKLRSRLLGYLYMQCTKSDKPYDSKQIFLVAVEAALTVKKTERLDALQYIVKLSSTEEELKMVAGTVGDIEMQEDKCKLLGTIGGSADKAGLTELAIQWFKAGIDLSKILDDPNQRAKMILKLGRGIERCGETSLAQKVYQEALENCTDNEELRERIHMAMKNIEHEPSQPQETLDHNIQEKRRTEENNIEQQQSTNNILALYDTYEGGLKPVHFRAIARAAPLCIAFGLDLALMGFPAEDLSGLVKMAITETNIGKGGKYLRELVEQGRVTLVACTQHKPPTNWNALGLPVATTSHPELDKSVMIQEALKEAKTQHKLHRLCIIMGLGKKGLPKSLLDQVQYHLELTGSNVPLETCTAMGVIAQQLRAAATKNSKCKN